MNSAQRKKEERKQREYAEIGEVSGSEWAEEQRQRGRKKKEEGKREESVCDGVYEMLKEQKKAEEKGSVWCVKRTGKRQMRREEEERENELTKEEKGFAFHPALSLLFHEHSAPE